MQGTHSSNFLWYRIPTMLKKHIITLGGMPGSGKSTLKSILAERLGYKTFSTGDFVRNLAVEKGMTVEEFNEVIAKTKDLDILIDTELKRIEKEEDEYVVDSHLAFHFIPSAFSVFLEISFDKLVVRIFNDRDSEMRVKSGDTMKTLEEARIRTQKRIDNHLDRYKRHYGVNPYIPSQHDFVINSESSKPKEISGEIIVAYERWLKE